MSEKDLSGFDADTFLDGAVSGEMQTKIDPIPVGDQYKGTIDNIEARKLDPTPKSPNGSLVIEVTWLIDAPDVAAALNRQKLTSRQSIFVDVTSTGALDLSKNKNVSLGRLREALGQNKPGEKWSPRNLVGAGPCLLSIQHRPDKNDSSIMYDFVAKAAKLS